MNICYKIDTWKLYWKKLSKINILVQKTLNSISKESSYIFNKKVRSINPKSLRFPSIVEFEQ
jgi:hypothetical protein